MSLPTVSWSSREMAAQVHGQLRYEVEHRRGVDRHAQCLVGGGVDLGRWQPAEVAQAVAEAVADGDHQLDITEAVLVADQVRQRSASCSSSGAVKRQTLRL